METNDTAAKKELTLEQFVNEYARPSDAAGHYVRNRETGKLELHFEREAYQALTDKQKADIKSAFLWGRNSGCWISRAKEPNLWRAERVAQALGLSDGGKTGERLSFAEQIERKQERAEARADRYETHAENAARRGQALQKPISDMHGDIAFFTQPNINSSAGRAFTRRRERMFASFERGFNEYRKSEYFQDRASIARQTASGEKLNDKAFVNRRIREGESEIRKLKKLVENREATLRKIENGEDVKTYAGELVSREQAENWLERVLDLLEAELDKLGFYQERLDELGGIEYSQENIRPGFIVNIDRWGECRVVSTGPKNFTYDVLRVSGAILTADYAEITAIVSAREAQTEAHPFVVGDTYTCHRWNVEKRAAEKVTFKIIRATDKSVTLQADSGKPFVRKPAKVAWSDNGEWRLCITDWNDGIVYKLPKA